MSIDILLTQSLFFSLRLERNTFIPAFVSKIANYLINLNLFPTWSSNNDVHLLQTQRISTRVFIITLIISFIVLFIYNAAIVSPITITDSAPTLNRYQELYHRYSSALSCPCSQISTNYGSFIHINYRLHPVCHSDFVDFEWIVYVSVQNESASTWDFRATGPQLFQALRALCLLADESLQLSIAQFNATSYVSALTTSEDLLRSQANAYVQEFIQTTTNNFLISLRLIGNMTQTNALMSGLFTNFLLYVTMESSLVLSESRVLENGCDCAFSTECVTETYIDRMNIQGDKWFVPGFYSGCYFIQALRQSDLGCLYDQACIDDLHAHIQRSEVLPVTPLDLSSLQYFDALTPIGVVIDRLIVDHWHWTVSHADYYQYCQPKQCTYTVLKRNSILTIVTIMIGMMGGLIRGLKLVVPHVVQVLRWLLRWRRSQESGGNIRHHFLRLPSTLFRYFTNLNLFESSTSSTDPNNIRTQRISTKLFILTFLLSFIILVIYNATIVSPITITDSAPTLNRYYELYQRYSSALSCPCSQISTNYGSFIQINYQLHSVCDSDFVTPDFITYIGPNGTWLRSDFRVTGPRLFQGLRALCLLANEALQLSIAQFNGTSYVSALTTSEDLLRSQANASVQHFIETTINNFVISLRLIGNMTRANYMFSGLFTSSSLHWSSSGVLVMLMQRQYANNCFCSSSEVCIEGSSVYTVDDVNSGWEVPGFNRGCFLFEALRTSDLHCLYDEACIGELLEKLESTQAMNVMRVETLSSSSHFEPITPLGIVIDQLMIDNWNWAVSYADYYQYCQPKQCTYTIMSGNSILTIVTIMIGLIGGLVTGLKIIVPRIVQTVYWLLTRQRNQTPVRPIRERFNALRMNVLQYCVNLNLFESPTSPTDPNTIRTQRISTKIFIVTFLLSFIILVVYNAAIVSPITITDSAPTLNRYYELYQRYSSALSCPCSQISTNYGSFIHINYRLHPVCHSDFVTPDFITYIGCQDYCFVSDFRIVGPQLFQALRALCLLADESLQLSIAQFNATSYVSALATSEDLLRSQANAYVQEFIQTTTNNFLISLRLIGNTTQANALVSGYLANMYFSIYYSPRQVISTWNSYGDSCSCEYHTDCTTNLKIHERLDPSSSTWSVPGFYRGCFFTEALRQSDLQCLYDEACLNDLQVQLQSNRRFNLTPLDSSSLQRFDPTTLMRVVIDQLMVDHWNWSVTHDDYYKNCQPMRCTYTIVSHNSIVTIVTTMIGLMGGLVTGLKLIIGVLVSLVMKCMRKRNGTTHPPAQKSLEIQLEEVNC